MPCALCLRERDLKLSHIIPEFLYESLYDDKHRLHILSALPEEKNQLKQKGERERLLCDECELLFSKYERYASLFLGGRLPIEVRREDNLLIFSGIDYAKFKLFQLSILWRAGVSTLPLFERVQLGPHSERLRILLLVEDPGPAELYACIMWVLTTSTGVVPALIMQPTQVRNLGKPTYRFTMGGLMWVYFVTSQPPGYPFQYCVLQKTGEAVMRIGNVNEMNDLRAFVQAVTKLGRAPKA
jgi:hypothetical protein